MRSYNQQQPRRAGTNILVMVILLLIMSVLRGKNRWRRLLRLLCSMEAQAAREEMALKGQGTSDPSSAVAPPSSNQ